MPARRLLRIAGKPAFRAENLKTAHQAPSVKVRQEHGTQPGTQRELSIYFLSYANVVGSENSCLPHPFGPWVSLEAAELPLGPGCLVGK